LTLGGRYFMMSTVANTIELIEPSRWQADAGSQRQPQIGL